MHFEPSKKNSFRFPSAKSVEKMDKQMYFPETPARDSNDADYNRPSDSYMPKEKHNHETK
ncbi:MAG: hypothetical protein GX059_10230 [Clostridiales bacterium]|jgi:hypothetical protein|nr:hypothetical protein [Clostridiales bacterium]